MRCCSLLAAGALSVGPAFAEMPRFDVEAHCKEIASFGGAYSESLNQSCFDMEQVAYDALKPNWDDLPPQMKAHCEEIASFGGPGSYSLLESCVGMETKAAASPKTFKY